uniref:Titin n=1 Tax=Oreochromis aureus TaxID=47969 RepID=A0AAZ1Y1Q7_OREAU
MYLSLSSTISESFVARDPCDPPGTPEAVSISKNQIRIQWTKPQYDGGSKVNGYIVERKDLASPDGRWVRANFTNIVETEYTVTGLTENEQYEFRVIARNAAGIFSEPSDSSGPITATDEIEPPRASMDPKYKDVIVVNAGENLLLDADIYGKPIPEVLWLKEGKEMDKALRTEVKTTQKRAAMTIKDVTKLDSGHYDLILKNLGGTKVFPITVKVLDKPGPPTGPMKVTGVMADRCILAWSEPALDGGASITHYVLEKRETSRLSWTVAASGIKGLYHKVTNLLPGDEYIFRVRAVNKYGIGDYLESEPIIARNPYKPPSAPGSPEASLITKDSIVLSWTAPEQTGGAEIEGYHLEKRDKDSVRWTKCNRQKLTDTHFKVTGLITDHFYEFRVAAENEVGMGDFSELSLFYRACDAITPPGPPHHPKVTDYTKTSVSLSWEKPEYDGGAKVSGYTIERRDLPEGRWTRCNFTNVPETHYDVTGLTENSQYDFRVIAKNAAGLFSIPSDNTGPITIRDDVEPPRIMIDVKFRETVFVKAGETLKINADLAGRPAPVISWTKDGKEIELRARIQIVSTDTSTCLTVKDCIRRDSGQYALTLQNIGGTVTMPINCVILDRPGPSAGPLQITGVTAAECTLSWGPPQESGGADITQYVVEKRETSRLSWTLVKADVTKTFFKVTGLLKDNDYIFRVLAVNRHGVGEALESDVIKVTDPYTFATAPASVDVTTITGDSMTLTWCKPANDGGSPITGYVIERREKTSMRWVRVNRDPVPEFTTVVTKLRKGCEYDFRVYAENAAGLSPPSEPSATFRAVDPLVVPSRPTKPKIENSTKDSVSIVWKPPTDDGGAHILGYNLDLLLVQFRLEKLERPQCV